MKKASNAKILKDNIDSIAEFIFPFALIVFCVWGIIDIAPKIMHYFSETNTGSDNLPTCPDSEKVIIGYRDGKPMKLCDQTYTFIFQDWNYSCMLTNNKDSGTLGFARSVGKSLGLNEKDSIAAVNQMEAATSCDLGRLSPEFIQKGYDGKGDGSVLTHTKTLGF